MRFWLMAFLLASTAGAADIPELNLRLEEVVLSQAAELRARVLEEKTGFQFDTNWNPAVRLKWLGLGFAGMYQAESGEITMAIGSWFAISRELDTPLRQASPEVVAATPTFINVVDHELGHALSDQVSRRNGLGPWYLVAFKQSLPWSECIGLNVISEGVGVFFEHGGEPGYEAAWGATWFPLPNTPWLGAYTEDMVYKGGDWVVHDVLHIYGERGLVWLIAHPFSLDQENMRASAVAYRERALRELAAAEEK